MWWPERMKFGIFLGPFHRVGENPTLAMDRDLELVQWLDHLGYDEAWIGEHHSAGWEIIDAMIDRGAWIIGTPDDCVAGITRLAEQSAALAAFWCKRWTGRHARRCCTAMNCSHATSCHQDFADWGLRPSGRRGQSAGSSGAIELPCNLR